MSTTEIEWTDAVWNPTKGCDRVSPGCDHCYAMTMAKRLKGMGQAEYQQDGDPRTSGPGFLAHEAPSALDFPLKLRTPKRIFVNSMSDLFHDNISDEYIARVWQVMASTPQHTYQILTKRHARMRSWVRRCAVSPGGWITHDGTDPAGAYDGSGQIVGYPERPERLRGPVTGRRGGKPRYKASPPAYGWPLPNVWLGVSVENQQWADIRIPALLDTPAAVRFLSCEPLLGPLTLLDMKRLDWVIAGGESGPGARPMSAAWARSLRDQCNNAEVPFLFKQWGSHDAAGTPMNKHAAGRELDGRTWDEYPAASA